MIALLGSRCESSDVLGSSWAGSAGTQRGVQTYHQRPVMASWYVTSPLWYSCMLATRRMMLEMQPLQSVSYVYGAKSKGDVQQASSKDGGDAPFLVCRYLQAPYTANRDDEKCEIRYHVENCRRNHASGRVDTGAGCGRIPNLFAGDTGEGAEHYAREIEQDCQYDDHKDNFVQSAAL